MKTRQECLEKWLQKRERVFSDERPNMLFIAVCSSKDFVLLPSSSVQVTSLISS